MTASSIISVEDLTLALPDGADRKYALQGLTFDLQPKEILCIVGESGSGKSLCAQTIMGLLPDVIRVERGQNPLRWCRAYDALRRHAFAICAASVFP